MTEEKIQWCLDRIASLKENVANNASAMSAIGMLENALKAEVPEPTKIIEPDTETPEVHHSDE